MDLTRIKIPSPYKWDGTCLPYFSGQRNIIYKFKDPNTKLNYWVINYCNTQAVCIVKSVKNVASCIYDELMPLFGLSKMGTHYVILGVKIYILYRVQTVNNEQYIPEVFLSNFIKENFQKMSYPQIRKIYIIRDLIGVSHTTDSDIVVRFLNGSIPYFISMKTYGVIGDKIIESSITETCKNKWFIENGKEISVRQTYKDLFTEIRSTEDIHNLIAGLSIKIDGIIERIDRNLSYIQTLICERILNQLLLMLHYSEEE